MNCSTDPMCGKWPNSCGAVRRGRLGSGSRTIHSQHSNRRLLRRRWRRLQVTCASTQPPVRILAGLYRQGPVQCAFRTPLGARGPPHICPRPHERPDSSGCGSCPQWGPWWGHAQQQHDSRVRLHQLNHLHHARHVCALCRRHQLCVKQGRLRDLPARPGAVPIPPLWGLQFCTGRVCPGRKGKLSAVGPVWLGLGEQSGKSLRELLGGPCVAATAELVVLICQTFNCTRHEQRTVLKPLTIVLSPSYKAHGGDA